jgi:hypothetical protein
MVAADTTGEVSIVAADTTGEVSMVGLIFFSLT